MVFKGVGNDFSNRILFWVWVKVILFDAICSGHVELSILKVMFNSAFLFLNRICHSS
jgi:hypothetical protein